MKPKDRQRVCRILFVIPELYPKLQRIPEDLECDVSEELMDRINSEHILPRKDSNKEAYGTK